MKKEIEKYIKDWERKCYRAGLPDHAPIELERNCNVPSYRKIAYAILKNDNHLKSLGLDLSKRTVIYDQIKRAELIRNGKIKIIQLKIF